MKISLGEKIAESEVPESLMEEAKKRRHNLIEKIVEQYADTDSVLIEKFEEIKNTILEEEASYQKALVGGKKLIEKEIAKVSDEVKIGDELMGLTLISADTCAGSFTPS